MRGVKAVADCLGKGPNGDRIAANRAVFLDFEPVPRTPPAPFIVIAHLFREAKTIILVQENPERTVVGPFQRIEDRTVQSDVLQRILAGFIGESRDTTCVEDDTLPFVIRHAIDRLDQRFDDVGLWLGPIDGSERSEPAGGEILLQAKDGRLAEESGDGSHGRPFVTGAERICASRHADVRHIPNKSPSPLARHIFVRHSECAS